MYWIVTPKCTFHARTHCYDKEVDVSYLKLIWSCSWSSDGLHHRHTSTGCTGNHPFTRQCWKLLYEDLRTTVERLWHALRKLLPTAGNSNKMFLCQHTTRIRDSRTTTKTPMSSHNQNGDHGTTHFTRISWKKEEKLCKKNGSTQYLK